MKDRELTEEPAYRPVPLNIRRAVEALTVLLEMLGLSAVEDQMGNTRLVHCDCLNCRCRLSVPNVVIQNALTLPGCRYGCSTPACREKFLLIGLGDWFSNLAEDLKDAVPESATKKW